MKIVSTDTSVAFVWQQSIILNDACLGTANPAACSSAYFGIMSKGFQSTIQTYLDLCRELAISRGSADGDMEVVKVFSSTRACSSWCAGITVHTVYRKALNAV